MENASKALIMAGGVLVGILILSLAAYLFVDFGTTAAEINEQNAQQQIVEFNSKFTSYESLKDDQGNWKITIYDIVTVIGYAQENNEYYKDNIEGHTMIVNIDNEQVQNLDNEGKMDRIMQDQVNMTKNNTTNTMELPKYSCKVTKYYDNGRVHEITFKRQP